MPGIGRAVDVLGDVGAFELDRVVACLTIDRVAAITRIPHERVIAGPEQGLVAALPADNDVIALAGGDDVIAGAAIDGELDLAGVERGGVDGVVASAAADDERVVGALGAGDGYLRRQTVDDDRCAAGCDADAVAARRAVHGHAVGGSVALAASRGPRQVDGDLRHAGSGEIVDRDVVRAACGVDLDLLDPVEVHGDAANVTGGAHATAVGGDVHVLADVGAVEDEPIRASPALDDVAAVARIPDERIVAVAKQGRVVAAAAGDGVAAIAAEQDIGALAPDDGVVAGAAIEGQCHIVGRQRRRRERIVAGASGDDERVDRLRPGDGDDRRQAGDGQSAVLALYLDHVVALGAGDGHGVRREVAGAAAGHRCQVDRDLRHSGAGQITDHDVVGTAFGVELDLLDAVEIHGHDTDVAGEAHAAAIALDVELLVDVGAVEHQCVGARLALDD